jgi:hypothetical protein
MALVTINDVGIISGTILRPLVGVWTADLVIDQSDASSFTAGTKVTIKSENGYSLSGTVAENRSGAFLDAVYVRVLGGAGGMGKASSARSYVQPGAFVRDVLNGLCADSGETLSSTVDASFLGTNLTAWSVIGGNLVMRNLRALLDIVAPSLSWRILSDGTLWIGAESWTQVTTDFQVMHQDPSDGSFHLGIESPFVVPGTSLPDVGNVGMVQDDIESGSLRSRVWVDIPGSNRGINAATQQMAKQALAGVDYYGTYVCQVVSQSADLSTVDISPVGARNKSLVGGLQRVPARYMTGCKVQVAPGATCLLGWDGGSPEGPFAIIMSGDSAVSAQILGNDPIITKTDLTALINAITSATYILATGPGVTGGVTTPLVFVPPANYGSTKVGAGH